MNRYSKNRKKSSNKFQKATEAIKFDQMHFSEDSYDYTPDKIRLVPFEKKDQWT